MRRFLRLTANIERARWIFAALIALTTAAFLVSTQPPDTIAYYSFIALLATTLTHLINRITTRIRR